MSYLIVSNNPSVKGDLNLKFIDGSYSDVLVAVRDLVHQGHSLISSPLPASIRMIFSPYRSILLGDKKSIIDEYYIDVMESSLTTYKKHMGVRGIDYTNENDYAFIDRELLKEAIGEYESLIAMNILEVE